MQYVLKECREGEHPLGPSKITDSLIQAIGDYMTSIQDVVWVYDGYWTQSRSLYDSVMKSSWDDVILDESQKKELTSVANKFFSSKAIYEDLGVPWKRGLMFYGPPGESWLVQHAKLSEHSLTSVHFDLVGNGKTISIRALMHELYSRKDKDGNAKPIPTLYGMHSDTQK
jgi:transitional endoplasmic reticulum ATPase